MIVIISAEAIILLCLTFYGEVHIDPDRPEIEFLVEHFVSEEQKIARLVELLKTATRKTIVYCGRRNKVDHLMKPLTDAGLAVSRYHAGMDSVERESAETRFARGVTPIMIATTAFGLGIDESDIDLVVNFDPPDSPEELVQMAGRAGRGGQEAKHIVFVDPHDYRSLTGVVKAGTPKAAYIRHLYETIVTRFFKPDQQKLGGTTALQKQRFVDGFSKTLPLRNSKDAAQKSSALALCEAFGLFETDPFRFTLTKDPAEVLQDFPIKEEEMEDQRNDDLRRLAVIFHYLNAPADQRRRILLEYLRHNALPDELEGKPLDEIVSIPSAMIEGILRLFIQRDFTLSKLILAVKSAGRPAIETSSTASMPLKKPASKKAPSGKDKSKADAIRAKAPKRGAPTTKEAQADEQAASKPLARGPAASKPATSDVPAEKKPEAKPKPEPPKPHATTIALSSMAGCEIKFMVERLVARGFLRWVPIPLGRRTGISITKDGLAWLDKFTAAEKPALQSGYAPLSQALYHPLVREVVREGLSRWLVGEFPELLEERPEGGSEPKDVADPEESDAPKEPRRVDIDRTRMQTFMLADVVINGEKIVGARLVRDYYMIRTRREWTPSEIVHTLNYYLVERLVLEKAPLTSLPIPQPPRSARRASRKPRWRR